MPLRADDSPLDEDTLERIRHELVIASRVLLKHGVVDAFGHVSARHPQRADRFLMSRRKAPGLVGVGDIREFALDGELVEKDGTPAFLERYIHSAIYAARPDVHSVVHSHSPGIVAFGVVDQPLRPICHTCGFLLGAVPVFEIRDEAGPATDLMIDSRPRGGALARALGERSVILMRGHGSTAVGPDVPRAVYRAIYTEVNAELQTRASSLGRVTFLTDEEAAAAERIGALQVERTWEFWKRELEEEATGASA